MARKLQKILVSQTEADLEKNKADQADALGFSSDKESIVFNQKTIRGVTEWGRGYLQRQQEAEQLSKLAASLTFSPASGSEMVGGSEGFHVTMTLKLTFDGKAATGATVKLVGTGSTPVFTGEGGTLTESADTPGTYTASVDKQEAASVTSGKLSQTFRVQVSYNGITKSFDFSYSQYAAIRFVSKAGTATVTAAEVGAATVKYVKASVAGSYSVAHTAGQYLWICVPSFMSVNKATSGGFDAPLEAAQSVTGVKSGEESVTYKCYRMSGAAQSSPVSLVIS